MQRAQSLAAERGNPQIEPLHLLAALLAETDGVIRPLLDKIGVNRAQLERIVEAELGALAQGLRRRPCRSWARAWPRCSKRRQKQADTMKDEFVSTEHLLLA